MSILGYTQMLMVAPKSIVVATGIILVTHVAAASSNTTSVTTGSINTTGSTLFVVGVVSYQPVAAPTLSDSTGLNTWILVRTDVTSTGLRSQLYYCYSPATSVSQTFTATGASGLYPSIYVSAFKGTLGSSVDQQNGFSTLSGGLTVQPGSITPLVNNEVCVTIVVDFSSNIHTIDSSYLTTDLQVYIGGVSFGGGMAYLIQTSSVPTNPTWTLGTRSVNYVSTSIASFK